VFAAEGPGTLQHAPGGGLRDLAMAELRGPGGRGTRVVPKPVVCPVRGVHEGGAAEPLCPCPGAAIEEEPSEGVPPS